MAFPLRQLPGSHFLCGLTETRMPPSGPLGSCLEARAFVPPILTVPFFIFLPNSRALLKASPCSPRSLPSLPRLRSPRSLHHLPHPASPPSSASLPSH